ncbi:hypothetical protein Mucpa_1810 [Mucilaginibacter paludis DSM 18603]|uniref:Uncharacterized protein n=2 Tax=Mucilaginibacter TaxID=423349 RepID=H1YA83_9SPHI|nr:hypothetical protein Mucpa_1810 [Mucilaginibacter paludis DSM 18603]
MIIDDIKIKYLTDFERIGKEALTNCGFTYEMLPAAPHFPEGFEMLLKKGSINYLLSFSTHHLDFSDGVMVCLSPDQKIHYEFRVLPPPGKDFAENRYGYNDKEIERLVRDICLL